MSASEDRLEALLVEALDRSLTETERTELERLLERNPDVYAEDFALAAAAVNESFARGGGVELPVSVRDAIVARGEAEVARAEKSSKGRPVRLQAIAGGRLEAPEPSRARVGRPRWSWMMAAAAAALAIAGWWPRFLRETPRPEPSVVEARASLIKDALDLKRLPWAAAGDPLVKNVSGELVWSNDRQSGFMSFAGLPVNDPTRNRYQLWIFDAERDERYPVDGGVFDVRQADAEVVVRIDAKLPVKRPMLFAVTLEGPDGAVVSTREHLLTVAKVL